MTTRSAPAIVYPESDGMPLPDGEYQAPIYRRIVRDLDDHFRDVAGVNVNGDTSSTTSRATPAARSRLIATWYSG